MLGWMYVIPLALFRLWEGARVLRGCSVSDAVRDGRGGGRAVGCFVEAGMAAGGGECVFYRGWRHGACLRIALLVPLASSGPLREFALKNNGDLREEIGWDELVKTVAGIRDSLPAEQRRSVLACWWGTMGRQGAVEILGPAYDLPMPISMTNSAWLRGYPTPQPTTLIVLGFSQAGADKKFTSCRLAGHNGNSEGSKERGERGPPGYFCVRIATDALAGVLDE